MAEEHLTSGPGEQDPVQVIIFGFSGEEVVSCSG